MQQSQVSADSALGDQSLLRLKVRLADGSVHRPEAAIGLRIMELIRAFGLPIKAECGGAGVCATCHVRIAPEWQSRLPAPSSAEMDKLDEIPDADDASRLACQIEMSEALDGLALELHPDSIALRATFLAG